LLAIATDVLKKAPSHTVTLLEYSGIRASGSDDADTFVAKDHLEPWVSIYIVCGGLKNEDTCVISPENEVTPTKSRCSDCDKDLVTGQGWTGGLGLNNVALGALEDCKSIGSDD
jgi:hypothetical protein